MKYQCGKCGKTKDYKFSCDCDESDDLINTVADIISIGVGISSLLSNDDDNSSSSNSISNDSTNDFEGFGGGSFGGGGAEDDW